MPPMMSRAQTWDNRRVRVQTSKELSGEPMVTLVKTPFDCSSALRNHYYFRFVYPAVQMQELY